MELTRDLFKKRFDTSLIEPQVSDKDLEGFIESCIPYREYFAGIAVNLHQVSLAAELLQGTGIGVAGAVAYPLGGIPTEVKIVQIEEAISDGADQVDVVMRVEDLLDENYEKVVADAEAVVDAANAELETISLIPNVGYLTNEQKLEAAKIVRDLGVTYKTNTGFGLVTSLEDVELVREEYGDTPKIMVSGGCRTPEQAIEFFNAGANKIATSTPFDIFKGFERLIALKGKME